MTLKNCFKLREVAGEYMLVPSGGAVDFNTVFSLSESAAWLWKTLQGTDFDVKTALDLVTCEYEVCEETAEADVCSLLEEWKKNGMIDD